MTTDGSEADLAEQQKPVLDEDDDLAGLDADDGNADVADAVQQRLPVPLDEEDA